MKTADTKAIDKMGKAGRKAGDFIAKIPVVRKGPVDEIFQLSGDKMMKHAASKTSSILKDFRNNRDSGIQLFADNIKAIDTVSNKPIEMLFDSEMVYLLECS